jgi:hypothetical protein
MIVSDAMNEINDAFRGLDDVVPIEGSDEWNYWLRTLNKKKNELYLNSKINLSDIWDVKDVGTIAADAAPSFTLADSFIGPSDSIYCVDADGRRTDFDIIPPRERDPLKRNVFIAGNNPKTLYFTNAILAGEPIVGATLSVPGYYLPDDVANDNDDLPFNDPQWVIMAAAAEIAFNDLVYEDKAPDLQTEADTLWQQMMSTDRVDTYGNSRKIPVRVWRIPKPTRR